MIDKEYTYELGQGLGLSYCGKCHHLGEGWVQHEVEYCEKSTKCDHVITDEDGVGFPETLCPECYSRAWFPANIEEIIDWAIGNENIGYDEVMKELIKRVDKHTTTKR